MTLFDAADHPAGPSGPTARVAMLVAYHGADYHGFAVNAGVRTVGGTLAEAIGRVLGHRVELTCAGRTDKGVHAWGQVVTFDALADGLDLERLQRSVNALCQPAIVVRDLALVAHGFDARFSATARTYRYTVLNRRVPDPFLHDRAWHVEHPLDLDLLHLGCDPFLGEHDFSSFCRRVRVGPGEPTPSLTRRVTEARWSDDGDGVLRFWITANAFCHQMVRSVVGTLVAVGRGRLAAGELHRVIAGRDRQLAPDLAPPHGLVLWAVAYDGVPDPAPSWASLPADGTSP